MAEEPFAAAIGRWFADDAHRPHPLGVTHRRQMNMALALAASKWLELGHDRAAMGAWIDATEARAETRRAAARAEAMRLARAWLR